MHFLEWVPHPSSDKAPSWSSWNCAKVLDKQTILMLPSAASDASAELQ